MPTYRYYFNVTAPANFLPKAYPNLGTYHGLDFAMLLARDEYFGPGTNTTAAELAQIAWLRQTFAGFAKNPQGGPGWNKLGSAEGLVVQDEAQGPIATAPAPKDMDLAVVGGAAGDIAGVEIVSESQVDAKCSVFLPMYQDLAALRGDSSNW